MKRRRTDSIGNPGVPSNDTSNKSNKPGTSRAIRWLSILVAPCLAIGCAVISWWWMPKPSLPPEIESADALSKNAMMAANQHAVAAASATGLAKSSAAAQSAQSNIPGATESGAMKAGLSSTGRTSAAGAATKTLVALGDSITFGFNLPGSTATKPSPYAYPFVVGNHEHWNATDLGVPGWETTSLLDALKTKPYQDALKQASVVTVDIGSNDLLHTTYDLLAAVQQQRPPKDDVLKNPLYQQALAQFQTNLPAIIQGIRQSTDAPIVLLNLYDPFPDGSSIHYLTEQVIAAANEVIDSTAAMQGLPVVDVYYVMNHHQDTFVRLQALDIHPTIAGQAAIANELEATLQNPLWHQPTFYATAANGTLIYSDMTPGPFAMYWLSPDDGLPISGHQGDWLEVMTPSGKVGYVKKDDVNVLLRPVNNVTFNQDKVTVESGRMVDTTTQRATNVFVRNGMVYAPVTFLAESAGAKTTYNETMHEVDVETLTHSGLIQHGLLNPFPMPGDNNNVTAPTPHITATVSGTARETLDFRGISVVVDGESENLGGEPVSVNNIVYVPADAFWMALGGTVTLDKGGLPTLSVIDS